MGREFEASELVGKLLSLRKEKEGYPTNVVFSRVGVGNGFPDSNLHFDEFVGFHRVRTFNNGDVLLGFPISYLDKFTNRFHMSHFRSYHLFV